METCVTEFLKLKGVKFRIRIHEQTVFGCEDAARERGVRLSQIVKCMVGGDTNGKIYAMLIPGDKVLKIKKVRSLAGGTNIKLLERIILSEHHRVIVGAISPTQFVGKAIFYIDNTVFREEYVDISSGDPRAGIEIKAEDLQYILMAIRSDIISTTSALESA